mmetsp:Transcript_48954/g.119900  ORF Transcript_48954/g.119900 Transcript_48954/m.119900 type:complete len:217 (+) Transcript_48954:1766-2416(+)
MREACNELVQRARSLAELRRLRHRLFGLVPHVDVIVAQHRHRGELVATIGAAAGAAASRATTIGWRGGTATAPRAVGPTGTARGDELCGESVRFGQTDELGHGRHARGGRRADLQDQENAARIARPQVQRRHELREVRRNGHTLLTHAHEQQAEAVRCLLGIGRRRRHHCLIDGARRRRLVQTAERVGDRCDHALDELRRRVVESFEHGRRAPEVE